MSRAYYVEVKLGVKRQWYLQKVFTRHTDALHYVKEHAGERYPFRIVRVIRNVVFDGER
jgi:hypothetical protein